MLEQLRSAGNHLHVAWDTYFRVYSALQSYQIQRNPPRKNVPSELSSLLDTQLAFISSYESKIQEIKVAISRARNYSLGLAPINSLPPEILSRIFQLVSPQGCDLHELSSDKRHFPTHPDHLTHVCSLWRGIAISCCSLWCHIDLTSYKPYYNALVERAETHSARAGQLPIELHVMDDVHSRLGRSPLGYDQLDKFTSRISGRVKTLNFFVEDNFCGFHRSVFSTVLLNQHSILTKLIVRTENSPSASIHARTYTSSPSDIELSDFLLDLTEDQIESSFAPLTVLHLQGVFPLWSSTAYHGLTDLRLLSTEHYWSIVKEAQLISLLKSSPGLRIFHFGLRIKEPTTGEVMPVNLQDLQVVKIFPDTGGWEDMCPSNVLRLLAPGSRPLHLSFGGHYAAESTSFAEWDEFFARSRVRSFHTCSILPPMDILLRHSAYIEHAILDHQGKPSWKILYPPQLDKMASLPRLRSLHLTRSALLEDDLRLLVEYCPNGIVLYSCYIYRDEGTEFTPLDAQALADAFPTIKNSETPPYPLDDPTADWDHLD
ncbi:unnamed protein product [Rhizoctonia solani]|uniref:F-box-like domain protein n=1 Tax=Rhizoctonia solani TaxID=456999 RepID=A0A8H2WK56_9AGAM|nr:unnamed protein product [Rhizoctonia solani]